MKTFKLFPIENYLCHIFDLRPFGKEGANIAPP
jgi:hypothetical protein